MSTNRPTLSRFTPSVMSHELLERLFVARERTLDAVMARVDAAAASGERNHTLLIGPRGAGKTHLVSLVYHRVNERRAGGARLQVSWLPEDPWTIVTYRHLLSAIVKHVEPEWEGDVPTTTSGLEVLIRERAAEHGPVVVVLENLDQVLKALGSNGQQQLRHLLQADRSLLLVATSTRLDRSLADQARPFYGFFTTTRLEPFGVDEAAAMLAAIANEQNDNNLVEYLQSDEGRSRLCTIAHLAGGQPRMWAALASALTVGGLHDLVELLLTRFDDLTPYYQEQLARLSAQQRLVVAELAELDRPVNVKELAGRLEIDQRSLAKTMTELVDRGWAAPTASPVTADLIDKRKTFYELAEPLARLSFQIKESRGEPLRLVVEFLKHWFDPVDLTEGEQAAAGRQYMALALEGHDQDPVVAVTRQLNRLPATRAPAVTLLEEIDDALRMLARREAEDFLQLPLPVRGALEQRLLDTDIGSVRLEIHSHARLEFGRTPHPSMDTWIHRAEGMASDPAYADTQAALLSLADWLGRAWRFDEAHEVLKAAADLAQNHRLPILDTTSSVAVSYWEAGRVNDAIQLEEALVAEYTQMLGANHFLTSRAKHNLSASYADAGRTDEAIKLAEEVVSACEGGLGADSPITLRARNNFALLVKSTNVQQGLALQEALADDAERSLGPATHDTLVLKSNLALTYADMGQLDKALALEVSVLKEFERLRGPDGAETLISRSNVAVSYARMGRIDEAIDMQRMVLRRQEILLGKNHPTTLTTRHNLAVSLSRAGKKTDAAELLGAVVKDRGRVLGTDHPQTLAAADELRLLRADDDTVG